MASTQEWAATDGGDAWVVQGIVGVSVPPPLDQGSEQGGIGGAVGTEYVGIALALNALTGEFEWLSLRDSMISQEQLAPLSTWTSEHRVAANGGSAIATGVLAQAPRGSRKREREAAAAARRGGLKQDGQEAVKHI